MMAELLPNAPDIADANAMEATLNKPAEIVVLPVYVFAPENAIFPVPILVIFLIPEMTPVKLI